MKKPLSVSLIRSKEVGNGFDGWHLSIGYRWRCIGIAFHPWGYRIMLIWWHLCIHRG